MDRRKISIQDVFEGTGISRNTISQLYNGKSKGIQFSTLTKLVDYFDVDLEEIFTEVTDYNQLLFDVEFNVTSDIEEILKGSLQITPENLASRIDESELFATILFIPTKYEKLKYSIVEFRLPLYISYNASKNVLWLFCEREYAFDDIEDRGDDPYNYESKYNEFIRDNTEKEIEETFLSIVGYIARELSFRKNPEYFGFQSDFGNRNLIYLWPSDTVLNEKNSKLYIKSKYGENL